MFSSLVCDQPATGRPELFAPQSDALVRKPPTASPELRKFARGISHAELAKYLVRTPRLNQVTMASRLEVRPDPEIVSVGIPEIDALTGGLPRGSLTEIYGPASSGRTTILMSALAAATRRGEACALVDVNDAFDPKSALAAGMNFQNLLWVRCGSDGRITSNKRKVPRSRSSSFFLKAGEKQKEETQHEWAQLEQAIKTIDLLLQSGGFGIVVIDLSAVPKQFARRIPLTSWFRFRRAVENTPTLLLLLGQTPCARTCASLVLRLDGQDTVMHKVSAAGSPLRIAISHAQLFEGLHLRMELQRTRMERKPVQSVNSALSAKAFGRDEKL